MRGGDRTLIPLRQSQSASHGILYLPHEKKHSTTREIGLCIGACLECRCDVFIQPPLCCLQAREAPPGRVASPLCTQRSPAPPVQHLHSFRLSLFSCSYPSPLFTPRIDPHSFIAITFLCSRMMQGGDRKATKSFRFMQKANAMTLW